jgi:FtsZ-interacting cell division protein ZipA
MRYILILVFVTGLYAQSKSCYTVQLTSAFNSQKNYDDLSSKSYDESCKVMRIGKSITVRCGCFDEYKDAKKTLPKFKKEYKKAYIASTYKYRFAKKPKSASALTKQTRKVETTLPTKKIKKQNTQQMSQVKQLKSPVQEIEVVDAKILDSKKQKQKKSKKKKVKKKKKTKYVKRSEGVYFYDRYLKKLENDKGIGKFDYRYKFGAQFSYDGAYINEAYQSYHNTHWR